MRKIAILTLLMMSVPMAQAQDDYMDQDGDQPQYQAPYQEPEQYRAPQQRYPTTTSNGDVIVPTGSGYSNPRSGDYYPETSPGWVINPRTGELIDTR